MTRLTNKLKSEIVTNWVKAKHRDEILNLFTTFKNEYTAILSATFIEERKVYLDNTELAETGYINTLNHAQLPYKISNTYLAGDLICDMLSVRNKDNCLSGFSVNFPTIAIKGRYLEAKNHVNRDEVMVIFNKFKSDLAIIGEKIEKVTSAVYGFTTVKALLDLLPEFSKYVPKPESKSTNIIPIDLVNTVKALL